MIAVFIPTDGYVENVKAFNANDLESLKKNILIGFYGDSNIDCVDDEDRDSIEEIFKEFSNGTEIQYDVYLGADVYSIKFFN